MDPLKIYFLLKDSKWGFSIAMLVYRRVSIQWFSRFLPWTVVPRAQHRVTLPKANISPEKSILKMMFLFQRWDMLVLRRVYQLYTNINYFYQDRTRAMLAYHHYKPTQCFVSPKLSSSVLYFLEPGCLPKSKCLKIRRSLGYNSR